MSAEVPRAQCDGMNADQHIDNFCDHSSFHQTGATGKISFDPNTGDRVGQPVLIQVRSTPSGEQFVALP